ncbi:PREDICTED: uncharacterized protein LOC109205669 [Nicotiana attenuata]|uniref:uncharacterized protein LOC109205669 n=1 Tax=Nicotiana attenuata TaxID=49451 RepID=UPI000904CD8F|nr:PREDICTED: uncharacterized protein LOC109205669 [Nicotiana attenuata]
MYTLSRPKYPKVEWKALTLGNGIPRHNFILWLALNHGLTTVDRLAKWGIQVDQDCVLCKRRQTENMEHIYFECQYTKYIWSKLLVWMGENHQIGTWLEDVTWMSKRARSGRAQNNMLVFLFAAVMYQVWTERNMRRFQGKEKEAERKVRDIVLQVHIKGQQNAKWKKRLEQLNSFP